MLRKKLTSCSNYVELHCRCKSMSKVTLQEGPHEETAQKLV